jgi:DNA-binding MltR family transcriptional regulator
MKTIQLSAKTPAFHLWHELAKETDRAVGVLGGAMIDELLQEAIAKSWRTDRSQLTKEVRKELLKDGGPLTFGFKINLAYVSGLLGLSMYSDIKRIKDLRNSFAHRVLLKDNQHKKATVTFNSQSIRDSCNNFVLVDRVEVTMDDVVLKTQTARERFLATVVICHVSLMCFLGGAGPDHSLMSHVMRHPLSP